MSNLDGFWNDARIEILKAMSGQAKSDAAIAEAIGGGCTRNMVHGKRHRLKLKVNAARSRVDIHGGAPRAQAPTPRVPRPPAISTEPEAIGAIEDFAAGCQWIHGDTHIKGWRMCGQPSARKRFCDYHHVKSVAPKAAKPVQEQQYAESARQGVMARTGLG